MSKRPSMREMLEKKDKQKGKEDRLEKGDFLALLIAASSTFWPILLGAIINIWLECHLCIIREAFGFSIFFRRKI